jgi:hypothetical protein
MTSHIALRLEVAADTLSSSGSARVTRRAEAELGALFADLNVDAHVAVTVADGFQPDTVAVLCRGADVIGSFSVLDLTTLSALGVAPDLESMPTDQLAELLAAIARQLASQDLPRTLGDDAIGHLSAPAHIVRFLLDLWIRVPDALGDELGDADDLEALAATVRPTEVRLRVAPAYLRSLTGIPHENAFAIVGARLHRRLGMAPPPLHFEAAPDVGAHLIQPVVNDVQMIPVQGLAPDVIVVDENPNRLREAGFAAEPLQLDDPDQELAVVAGGNYERLAQRYTCWNAVEVIASWWESFAPTVAWRTFDRRDIERLLTRLRPALPVLTRVADQVPAGRLTASLRSQYRSESHLQGLPFILERKLEGLLLGSSPQRD